MHRQKLIQFLDTLRVAAQTGTTSENGLEKGKNGGRVIDFFLAFRCLTADTIMDYCFQQDLNALGEKDFQSKTVEAFIEGFDMALVATYFPNLFGVLNAVIFKLSEEMRAKYFAPVYGFQMMQKVGGFFSVVFP